MQLILDLTTRMHRNCMDNLAYEYIKIFIADDYFNRKLIKASYFIFFDAVPM